ncbi:MAG: TIGR04283 family arsenosugar biosynthesis glycosyltransferase [Deltaproteobacteria bacterium]|nr:TIGR04283 family arsenosugar biosynthesis glycosyltransferase [Deltaproteobacteria bacterium]
MRISVVIPVLNEEKSIGATLKSLLPLQPYELFVVDGGSTDGTREICRQLGVEALTSPRGRASQMNHGAENATGDVLLFLHADTRLPPTAFSDIREALKDPRCVAGRFDVQLDGNHWVLGLVGRMISLRSRLSKISTGDQGIFVRRDVFKRLGGFPDIPLMEDIAFCRGLKRVGEVACLRSRVITSARRWESDGLWRTIFKMWTLKSLYLLGVSPHRLKQFYDDAR